MTFKNIVQTVLLFLLGTSWRTSLLGYVAAIAAESAAYFDAVQGGFAWHFIALAFLALARLAKDAQATGGTKPTTPEAAARVES